MTDDRFDDRFTMYREGWTADCEIRMGNRICGDQFYGRTQRQARRSVMAHIKIDHPDYFGRNRKRETP